MANADPQKHGMRKNPREREEYYITGEHVSLQKLKVEIKSFNKHPMEKYITKDILPYPTPVEFWVSDVAHVTEESGFNGIMKSEGFRSGVRESHPPECEFVWWDLKITNKEIKEAEQRYNNFPDQAQKLNEQKPFLEKFTTSPLFKLKKSRFGNYRFTFPLTDLMQWYKEQNCGGKEPVLRVFKTVTYKQLIVYSVLVHSPDDSKRFGEYPLLVESEWVHYHKGQIIWKAQAICGTHEYQFVSGEVLQYSNEFYVWDQVSLVFHLPNGTKLKIPRKWLIEALEACEVEGQKLDLSRYKGCKTKEERFLDAKNAVSKLKGELKEEEKEIECKEDDIKMEVDT